MAMGRKSFSSIASHCMGNIPTSCRTTFLYIKPNASPLFNGSANPDIFLPGFLLIQWPLFMFKFQALESPNVHSLFQQRHLIPKQILTMVRNNWQKSHLVL
jgi:hypothetical protein